MKHHQSATILSAGMPRSGSTLIYNLLRLTVAEILGDKHSFQFGWVGDFQESQRAEYTLLKIHEFDPQLVSRASLIVYSYRDVREAIASAQRKFGVQPSLQRADAYINQFRQWCKVAHIKIRYESFDRARQIGLINEVAKRLPAGPANPDNIFEALDQLPHELPVGDDPYDSVTLYHSGHITDGGFNNWKEQLEPELIASIEAKHHEWLSTHGYELTT